MRASRTWKIKKKNTRSEHAKVIMIVAWVLYYAKKDHKGVFYTEKIATKKRF